ncbi:MAG: arginine--tRNA ligase, partial [Coriobacteriia bacterium]|nr:arginine--tRNA ligase [Coriobacteriia bacterium]
MRQHAEKIVCEALKKAVDSGELKLAAVPEALVERPRDPEHGDWATALALRLSKELRRAPREIAEVIAAHIQQDASIASVEVAGPGFINLRLSEQAHQQVIRDAREQKSAFGSCDVGLEAGVPKTINVEFISANPTGPMHVGHGRWAALGNALCNVLEHAGWQVTREFYVNDAGSQMDLFGESIVVRYLQLCGLAIKLADNHYAGAYIIDLAQAILDLDGQRWFFSTDKAAAEDEPVEPDTTAEPEKPTEQDMTAEPDVTAEPEKPTEPDVTAEKERLAYFREFGYTRMLEHMKAICAQLGVHFDIWYSERSLYQGAAEHETEEGGAQTASPLIQMLRMLDAGG